MQIPWIIFSRGNELPPNNAAMKMEHLHVAAGITDAKASLKCITAIESANSWDKFAS